MTIISGAGHAGSRGGSRRQSRAAEIAPEPPPQEFAAMSMNTASPSEKAKGEGNAVSLHVAAESGDVASVESLLAKGHDIDNKKEPAGARWVDASAASRRA